MLCRAMNKWIHFHFLAFRIDMDNQFQAQVFSHFVAEFNHFRKFPHRIDMHYWERRLSWIKCLHCDMKHYRGILSNRIQHYRVFGFSNDLPHDMDRLGFQSLKMGHSVLHSSTSSRPSGVDFIHQGCYLCLRQIIDAASRCSASSAEH